jgi:hypothetical protein
MDAHTLLSRLRSAGLTVSRNGDQLVVAPRHRLTEHLRAEITNSKHALLDALRVESGALESRIRTMATRWGYSPSELAEALSGAQSDPQGWLVWAERDERDFGSCVSAADFATRYAQLRGLA